MSSTSMRSQESPSAGERLGHGRHLHGGIDMSKPICSVEICAREARTKGWCTAHYQRVYRHGDLRPEEPIGKPNTGLRGPESAKWKSGVVSYDSMHHRVNANKGRASKYRCVDCGKRARQWSYDGLDPDEVSGPKDAGNGTVREFSYSLKLEHYDPRCVSCHKRFDDARRLGEDA